jgi:predicted nucleotidyltransferase component of viral defense system
MENNMTFHLSSEFMNAVEATAKYHKLQAVFIEKDYWVTYVLKNIALSEYQNQVVFKGGTSLSKAYRCIERFSEDIDLALLKAQGLEYQQDPKEKKGGHLRKTYWCYPKFDGSEAYPIKENILLEINSFTMPVRHESIDINSYVGEFLIKNNFTSLVKDHDLYPFSLQVLSRERTFYEKLLALTRLSYQGTDKLKEKIRHFYDLYQLYQLPDLGESLFAPKHLLLIENIMHDDKNNHIFRGDWEGKRLSQSPLITQLEEVWQSLAPVYERELSLLAWREIPPAFAVFTFFQKLSKLLIENDL